MQTDLDNAKTFEDKLAVIREDRITQYSNKGVEISPAVADEEIFAKFFGDTTFVTDEDLDTSLENLLDAAENYKERNAISEFLHQLKQWVLNKLGKTDVYYKLSDIEKEWLKLVKEAQSNYESKKQKATADNGGVKYDIGYTTENIPVAIIEENILDGVPKSDWVKTVKKIITNKFSAGIPISGRLIKVNKITKSEFTNSKYSKYIKGADGTIYADKFKTANNLDDVILATTNYINEDLNHERTDNIKEFARGDVLIRVGNNDYSAKVIVGFTNSQNMVLYDIVDFEKTDFEIKKKAPHTSAMQNAGSQRNEMSSNHSIPTTSEKVNTKYSIPDTEYLELAKEPEKNEAKLREMVDKAAKDAGYNSPILYHGTPNGEFTIFDMNKSTYSNSLGRGFYFTDKSSVAGQYRDGLEKGGLKKNTRKILSAYIKLQNPFIVSPNNYITLDEAKELLINSKLENWAKNDFWRDFIRMSKDNRITTRDFINRIADLEQVIPYSKYDGIIDRTFGDVYSDYFENDAQQYVVYNSSQIKSADPVTYDDNGNVIPLSERFNPSNEDIRYSIPDTDSDGNKLSAGQQEYFKDSKARDENGNLRVVYHGTNAEFYTFRQSGQRGDNGAFGGIGFYFTDDKNMASRYGKNVLNVYLDIKKPLSQTQLTLSQNELNKFFDALAKEQKEHKYYKGEWYGNSISSMTDYLKSEYKDYNSDQEWLDSLLNWFSAGDPDVMQGVLYTLKNTLGYDGYINNGISIAFTPEQIKLTTNLNPTENEDIRYSLPDDVDNANKNNYNSDNEVNDDGTNSEILGKRTIPTVDGSRNDVRQQSTNTEKLRGYLEKVLRRSDKNQQDISAGNDGWLYEELRQKFSVNSFHQFITSIRGRIQGRQIQSTDSIGRVLNKNIQQKFAKTIFADSNGKIFSLYHWTKSNFSNFEKGEFGFHFGTLEAAHDIYIEKADPNITGTGIYKEVYLNITNPLYCDFDAGIWTAESMAYQLSAIGKISNAEYERICEIDGAIDNTYDNNAANHVRELLRQLGYDGVVYYNESENKGSLSAIALDNDQILTVAENGVLKENTGVTEASDEGAFSMPENKYSITDEQWDKSIEDYGAIDETAEVKVPKSVDGDKVVSRVINNVLNHTELLYLCNVFYRSFIDIDFFTVLVKH